MATFESSLKSKLIYVFAISDERHSDCLKIGETTLDEDDGSNLFNNNEALQEAAHKRIRQYTKTAGIAYQLLHTEISIFVRNGMIFTFNDKQVHKVLERSGIRKKEFEGVKGADEWYCCDLETVKKAIHAVKNGESSLHPSDVSQGKTPIIFRPEQRDAIDKTIKYWQYADRLVGMYEEAGVSINREPFGPLTGTLIPPCISNSVAIIEALLAATQGVKDITVGYGQIGNLIQDVAAMRALAKQTKEYLHKYGFDDVRVTTVFHQWMGGFPQDESKAFGVISWGSAAAALSKATKVIVKTPHEAYGVPTKEANASGLKATKQVISMLRDQDLREIPLVVKESTIIETEVKCIMDKVEELGKGDIAIGTVAGFESGVLDIPFAPNRHNAGRVLPARDNDGAIRILEMGNLPLSQDLKDFHRMKLEERAKFENRQVSLQMVIDDVSAIEKGFLVGRPETEHMKHV